MTLSPFVDFSLVWAYFKLDFVKSIIVSFKKSDTEIGNARTGRVDIRHAPGTYGEECKNRAFAAITPSLEQKSER